MINYYGTKLINYTKVLSRTITWVSRNNKSMNFCLVLIHLVSILTQVYDYKKR